MADIELMGTNRGKSDNPIKVVKINIGLIFCLKNTPFFFLTTFFFHVAADAMSLAVQHYNRLHCWMLVSFMELNSTFEQCCIFHRGMHPAPERPILSVPKSS